MPGTQKKKRRVWPWILAVALVAVFAIITTLNVIANRATQPVYASYTVETGSIETTITGSGTLAPADTVSLDLPGGVLVDEVLVRTGDTVAAGDAVARLNADSLRYRAAEVSTDLASLDRQLLSQNSVASVKATVGGRVKYLPVSEGDDVLASINAYGALALLSANGDMTLTFASSADVALYSEVTVRWDDGEEDGVITAHTADGYTVTFPDDTAPYLTTAEVYLDNTLLGEGTIEISAPIAVLASGGEIDDIKVSLNSKVRYGATLFTIENGPDSAAYEQALQNRTEKAALYQALLGYLADPVVYAPEDGLIGSLSIYDGEQTAASAAADGLTSALTLHTGGAVKMVIDVDELDILSVSLGQSVAVTLDAYADETFEAEVTHISRVGSASGSITAYPVEVTLTYDSRLLEGMNGSAVIKTGRVENVPVLPVSAIYEDSESEYVLMTGDDGSLVRKDITTGLSDGTYAEVTDGLAAGDIVLYLDTSASSTVTGFGYTSHRWDTAGSSSNGGE